MKCSAATVVFAEVVFLILIQSSVVFGDRVMANDDTSFVNTIMDAFSNCVRENIAWCLKSKILEYANGKHFENKINLMNKEAMVQRENSTLIAEESSALDTRIEERLVTLGIRFLENDFLRFIFPASQNLRLITLREEGRKKKLKGLIPLIIALKLKALALIPIYLYILSTLAMKALMIGKIALSIAGIILASKLLAPARNGFTT